MTILLLHTIVSLLLTTSCGTSDDMMDMIPPLDIRYESCCGAEPVEFEHFGSYVYIPNVFVIDGDDRKFRPYVSTDVQDITFMSFHMDSDTSQVGL